MRDARSWEVQGDSCGRIAVSPICLSPICLFHIGKVKAFDGIFIFKNFLFNYRSNTFSL